jgi:galactokinase
MSANVLDALSSPAARRVSDALARVRAVHHGLTGGTASAALFVPGRIEVLGKHTDYAGGQSLTCAVERGFSACYTPRADAVVRIVDARDERQATFALSGDLDPPIGHWSNYPMTVGRRLARNFPRIRVGADIAFYSDLPKAAGLSTSSALITAVYLVLAELNAIRERPEYVREIGTPERLAGYLGSIENGQAFGGLAGDHGVGTFGGSEDHTAILLSVAGMLGGYRYRPVTRTRQLPLTPGHVFVVAASGIAADKTGSARDRYNRASSLVATLLGLWRRETGGPEATLADVVAGGPEAIARLREVIDRKESVFPVQHLRARLDHFLVEDQEVLPAAIDALDGGDLEAFGRVVDRSQQAAADLLGNQVPETITLARLARELGASAASAFGAGFGGSVWALVQTDRADALIDQWRRAYAVQHPIASTQSHFFVTSAGPGAAPVLA